jgi:hypothetical protein
MALNQNANTAKFEDPDMDGDVAVDSVEDQAAAARKKAQDRLAAGASRHAAEKPAEETSKSTDVAVKANTQIAARKPMINPLEPLKNAFPVEFDTLRSLKVSGGNLVDNQTGKALGDTAGLELLSYQDQWVISPGVDGDEAKEHVRYSDDGKVTTKGEDCNEYLGNLQKAGYDEAKMSKRTVICGSLFDIGDKGRKVMPELQDSLVQISLAPTSKASFDRYTMDQAFKIAKNLIEPDGAQLVKIECTPTSKNGKDWTVANFSRWTDTK